MGDNLPGRSADEGAGRPLTAAQFRKRELERRALDVWIETQSYAKVKNALKLRTTDVAREMVEKGEQRWIEEEKSATTRHLAAQVRRMYEIINKSRDSGDWAAVDREMKAWERLDKLLGLAAVKDVGDGPTVVVIDGRAPWERGEVIDGEVVNEKGLPEGSP